MQRSPIAGRVSFFLENWVIVTRDQFCIKGSSRDGDRALPYSCPKAGNMPLTVARSEQESALIQEELVILLRKGLLAIEKLHPLEPHNDFYLSVFLVPKIDGSKANCEPKSIEPL